jgi:hypothetical protein
VAREREGGAMKRTWLVYVEQGIGHEYHNAISESEFFGPFTEQQARKLEAELNNLFNADHDTEHQIATSMPLEVLSPREVVRRFKDIAATNLD